ncbi:transaldolase [Streptomyces sp. NBC_01304]|uniref:transaldolase n=1 Tax=Streptomyces sp. NBC_01304 TaxID=2903818 RepID=UPI002E0F966D|nr:transaldolase [Streptomyces sp. NBC_01304]
MKNLEALADAGVSIWLDDLSRSRIVSGNLAQLMRTKHITGVTTNPSIFHKAIMEGDGYQRELAQLAARGATPGEAVRMITAADVRAACDVLRPVFDASEGRDGRVSLEVDPAFAHDTAATVAEAEHLWWLVDRPNAMIKIPATEAGLPAITEVIGKGICVNVTLIFSLDRYRHVLDAYQAGLERALAAGIDTSTIESVASFFVSRVDAEIDPMLERLGTLGALARRGGAGLANARLAYQAYEESTDTERWMELQAAGGNVQRPLWASTGVKNPAYEDTMYVTGLVAPDTVNTMPEATLDATADHAVITGDTVSDAYERSAQHLADLADLGSSYGEVVQKLEKEGVERFQDAWSELLASVSTALGTKG